VQRFKSYNIVKNLSSFVRKYKIFHAKWAFAQAVLYDTFSQKLIVNKILFLMARVAEPEPQEPHYFFKPEPLCNAAMAKVLIQKN
jgi:hypothetical protein